MADLNRALSDNLTLVLGGLALVLLVLVVVVVAQAIRIARVGRAYRTLVGDEEGASLQGVLERHIGRVAEVGTRLGDLDHLYTALEQRTRGSLQHIGLVRFNPFEDTGSDQSFAIALLDDRRDGVVVSSLHGRSNTRIFAKPVEGGASRHTLSTEESEAIRIAVEGTASTAGER